MFKHTITYTDYNGQTHTEDFYFNISRAELASLETSVKGGYTAMLERLIQTDDTVSIYSQFEDLVKLSYGEKSPDGKRFVKSKELTEAFVQSEAYSELIMQLLQSSDFASTFVNNLVSGVNVDKNEQDKLKQQVAEKLHILPES